MNKELQELKRRISSLSDDELLTMVHADFLDYREEAIQIAKEELKKRNLVNETSVQELKNEITPESISKVIEKENLKNHYFIRTIIEMSQRIKKLEKDTNRFNFLISLINEAINEIKLENIREHIQSKYKLQSDSTVDVIACELGVLGVLFLNKSISSNNKIDTINDIKSTMAERLCTKLSDNELEQRSKLPFIKKMREIHKEEKDGGQRLKECRKKFLKMVNVWLNIKVLAITNEKDFDEAWKCVLNDPELSEMNLINLSTSVGQRLMAGRE